MKRAKRKGAYKGRTPGSKNKVKRPILDRVRQIRVNDDQEYALDHLHSYSVLKGLRFQDCLAQAVEEYLAARSPARNAKSKVGEFKRRFPDILGKSREEIRQEVLARRKRK